MARPWRSQSGRGCSIGLAYQVIGGKITYLLSLMAMNNWANVRGPLLVDAMLRVGYTTFMIGTLGFLGVGLLPLDPDWGSMVNEARKFIFSNQLVVIWPALSIATLVIGLNMFADGLREESTRYQK